MQSEFESLRRLEVHLSEVARAEGERLASAATPRRRRHWRGWATAVAALLVVAGLIGGVIGTSNVRENAMSEGSSSGAAAVGVVPAPRAPGNEQGKHLQYNAGGDSPIGAPLPGLLTQDVQGAKDETVSGVSDLSKIIRDGQLAVTIDDGSFSTRSIEVSRIAVANHGSVLSSSTSGGESGSFTLRIPAANFEKTMNQLSKLGTVDSSEVHGQDVTAQYIDLKAHMKIYVARRKVLFGLMEQANSIGETLTVQRQLDDVQLKIDQIQGQLNYINKQVAESTIKVDLHEPDAAVATPPAGDVENPSLGRAWDHAVQGFLNVLAAVTIGLGYLIPIGIVIAMGSGIAMLIKRRRAGPTSAD
jgi:uncharacterized protein DUF4349